MFNFSALVGRLNDSSMKLREAAWCVGHHAVRDLVTSNNCSTLPRSSALYCSSTDLITAAA